ncbi:MAG TPA: nucleoside-diphosphate sugar epimerase/dehydratase [Candidatus Sumerlaeota bacterium]|nr:nucleoside-diphosphate sugar epimerase/dehydratase [Candidatus Sumerlaeota bacterium]
MEHLRRFKWVLIDFLLVALALVLAYTLRMMPLQAGLAPDSEWKTYLSQALVILPIFSLVRVGLFYAFGLYRGVSRYAGVHELRLVILALVFGTLLLLSWCYVAPLLGERFGWPEFLARRVPWPVVAVDWMGCLIFIGGARLISRLWYLTRFDSSAAIANVLIIGTSDVGELVARNFLQNPQMGFRPVGFVDEDGAMIGRQIHGLKVLGEVENLPGLIQEHHVSQVVVALHKPSLQFLNNIVSVCETAHVGFKIMPAVSDLMKERISVNQIRPVEIEDLLGREPVDLTLPDDQNYLRDETVLITGAGGSIGSELCRQIKRCHPSRMILLGRGENSIYEIATELKFRIDDPSLALEIADIQDVDRLEQVFLRYRPTVVFHAAAHKHVPLMELHPEEALKNNIIGTFNVAFLSERMGVKRFIMISTDKAVHPTNVMGASKRVAEMVVAALSHQSHGCCFLAVRFGNVLGSRGSVVPLFKKQIAAGGPVTVTHPEVERYFMTIPEASNLVLQAGAIGQNGQLFLLDMGEPVRIADLARRMITLSGYEPGVDIEISYVGMRPGEKLIEELLTSEEDLAVTDHPKIFSTRVDNPTFEEAKAWLKEFDYLAHEGRPDAIIAALRRVVPEYQPMRGQLDQQRA